VKIEHEAEESLLLETVARERLMKTRHAGRGLAGAVVICELWRQRYRCSRYTVSSPTLANRATSLQFSASQTREGQHISPYISPAVRRTLV
jgi:hypothetical protein